MCEFKHCTVKVGLKIYPGKNEDSQQPKLEQKKRSRDRQHQSGNINQGRKHQISWTNGCMSATVDNPDQESNQGCLGDILQLQARVDFKIIPSAAQASLVRHGDHTNYELRLRNMDTLKRTREFDSIDAAKNGPHEFLRTERIEEETNNDERKNDAWIKTAKDQKSWKRMESIFCNDDSGSS